MKTVKLAVISVLAIVLTAWTPNPPDGISTLFSQNYNLTGLCNAGDMVYKWSINGAPGGGGVVPAPDVYGASFIYPWTQEDITIRGASIVLIPSAPGAALPAYPFLAIGNNANGDMMLWLDASSKQAQIMYPAGTGFQFPGIPNKTPLTYMDLHGACTNGMTGNVMLTFWFTKNPVVSLPPAAAFMSATTKSAKKRQK